MRIHHNPFHKEPDYHKDIYIRKDQIMGDVDAQIEIVANTHLKEDGTINPVFDNAETRYKALFDRWLNKYVDLTKSRMSAYLLVPEQHGAMNADREWAEIKLHMAFPWYWNDTTFPQLVGAIHDYIVNSILKEFFSMTITSRDPVTADKELMAEDAYIQIKHCCVSAKPGTMRKKLHPF